MKVQAHCFAYNAKIDPPRIYFNYEDAEISIVTLNGDQKTKEEDRLMLKATMAVSPEDLLVVKEEYDDDGLFIEKQMRPYKEFLTEVAQLVEGLLSIMYVGAPIKFESDRIIVNVNAETPEEDARQRSGEITQGFGNVAHGPRYPKYMWTDKIFAAIPEAANHVPALLFLAQALRSQDRNDQEVAFFLYFRIIDGYFADGAKDVEKAILAKSTELSKYLDYRDDIKTATKSILTSLKLTSKTDLDFKGLLTDMVMIRHKLTHFSERNAHRHHTTSIIFDLNVLNFYLRRACILVLREKIGIDKSDLLKVKVK